MLGKKKAFLIGSLVFAIALTLGCTRPPLPPPLKPCSFFPLDPECTCPADSFKTRSITTIPEESSSIGFECVAEEREYVYKLQESSAGVNAAAFYCRRVPSDSPFAGMYPFNSNEACLSALQSRLPNGYCPLQAVFSMGLTWVAVPVEDKVVCNETTDYHLCSTEGWIVQPASVRTTGQSYCPATGGTV